MSTYAIGDVQGCYESLRHLLDQVAFDPTQDELWFTGDLVNRGPKSLDTLRFIKSLNDRAITVLGNHDLTLLAVAFNAIPYDPKRHTFKDILDASDCDPLIEWLRHQPLLHHDAKLGYTMVHAGLHPAWDLALATHLAKEVETALQGSDVRTVLTKIYGNEPSLWDPELRGYDRLRFSTNCFTHLRFCSPAGQLEFNSKEGAHTAPAGYLPWFAIPNRKSQDLKILFGHWAALEGKCDTPNVFALDTGCVWGGYLTAMRLEDGKRFKERGSNKRYY